MVLCAGAIGSPQLLMLSGIEGPPSRSCKATEIAPQHDLPAVGRNLSDHPMAISLFDASGKDSLFAAEKSIQLVRLLLRRRGLLTSNVGEGAAFLHGPGGELAGPTSS